MTRCASFYPAQKPAFYAPTSVHAMPGAVSAQGIVCAEALYHLDGLSRRPWASTTTSSWVKRNEGRFHRKRVPLDLVGAHPVVPGNVPGKRLRPIWSLPVRDKGQRPHHPRSKRPPQTRQSVLSSSATARRWRRSRSARTRRIPSVLTPWARRSTVINWCQYQAGHSRSR